MVIVSLDLDGSTYRNKDEFETNGILVQDSVNVRIKNCIIRDFHDGVVFSETGIKDDEVATARLLTAGSIEDCDITDCFPGFAPTPPPNPALPENTVFIHDRGHSGIWAEVKENGIAGSPPELARIELNVSGTRFVRNRDGIETDIMGGLSLTDIQLSVTDCDFQRNENGVEAVSGGGGDCTVIIDTCRFLSNMNAPACLGGYQTSAVGAAVPNGAIVHRNVHADIIVRNSVFKNNGLVAFIQEPADLIDFGMYDTSDPNPANHIDSPGNNAFLLDALPAVGINPCQQAPQAPYGANDDQPLWIVMMRVDLPPATTQEVHAYGNRWIGNNQYTSPDGCLTPPVNPLCVAPPGLFGKVCGADNFASVPFSCEPLAPNVPRNLSLDTGAAIYFGPSTFCPPPCGPSVFPPCPADVLPPESDPFPACPTPL